MAKEDLLRLLSQAAQTDIQVGKGKRKSAANALRGISIPVGKSTLRRIDYEETPGAGEKIARRAECALKLEADDASLKDELYLNLTDTGLDSRTKQAGVNAHRWKSFGFLEAIAVKLGFDVKEVQRAVRAMRMDFFSSYLERPDLYSSAFTKLREQVSQYADDFQTGHPKSDHIKNLNASWNGEDLRDFYVIFYGKHLLTWTPYEFEALKEFYQARKEAGSKLSLYDRIILTAGNVDMPFQLLNNGFRSASGIKYSEDASYLHQEALLHGRLRY